MCADIIPNLVAPPPRPWSKRVHALSGRQIDFLETYIIISPGKVQQVHAGKGVWKIRGNNESLGTYGTGTKFAGIRKTLEFDFDFDWRRGLRPRRNCWGYGYMVKKRTRSTRTVLVRVQRVTSFRKGTVQYSILNHKCKTRRYSTRAGCARCTAVRCTTTDTKGYGRTDDGRTFWD